jgi:hypothetical protein
MNIREAIAFREMQQRLAALEAQVEQMAVEHAARLAVLERPAPEAGECPVCAQRRAGDAARQRRLRHRYATELPGQIKIT